MTDYQAYAAGYTRELFISSEALDAHVLVRPDADLDGKFKAWDSDYSEWISVNGWLFEIEDATGNITGLETFKDEQRAAEVKA